MKKLMVSAMIALMMLALSAPVALAKDNDGGQKGNGHNGHNSASADRNDSQRGNGHHGNGNDRNDFDGVNLISVDHDNDFDRDHFDSIDLDDSSDLDIDYDLDGSDWQVVVVDLNGNGVIYEFEYQIALSSL